MDYVLNAMLLHYESVLGNFVEAQRTGEYKRFSDNPFYSEMKALIDSMNILREYLGWEVLTLKQEVEFYL